MKRGKPEPRKAFFKEKKIDLIFSGIALVFLIIMISLLIRYTGLRKQNQARPEEYGTVMQDLNSAKAEKTELESKIDALMQEIAELDKKISALRGN